VSARRIWLERGLNLATALALAAALYLVAAQRVVPALRGTPTRVLEGERLAESYAFEVLGPGRDSGEGSRIEVPGRRSALLLVFNSTCPACYANLDAWRAAVRHTAGLAEPLAVALERDERAAAEYARRNLAGVRAVAPVDARRFAESFGIDVIPFTALVDSDSVLAFARQGSLDSLAVRSLIGALGALKGSSNTVGKDGEG